MNQVVIITHGGPGELAVEYDRHTTVIREHVKQLRMGRGATKWLVDTLYEVLQSYTDEVFTLKSPIDGKIVLAVFRDTGRVWIEGVNVRFSGDAGHFRNILTAIEHLHSSDPLLNRNV